MGKAIQDFNLCYAMMRPLVCFGTICHYTSFTVRGKKNLPKKVGYIIAPCHQQALMEPLAVLATVDKAPVFLARADIFAKPTIRKILTTLRIMPVYRIRDGKESLSKNTEIFEKSRNVVLDGYPFCMMAEGRHNNRHQLLPLVKGMFRIAGETQKQLGETPLYIVPMGIDYDEYERTYANVCINYGEPIPIQPFMDTFNENEPVALNQMRDTLTTHLHKQMFDIRSQKYYDEFYTLCNILNRSVRKKHGLRNTPWNRFVTRQRIANALDDKEQNQDSTLDHIIDQTHQYQQACKRIGIPEKLEAGHWHFALLLLSTTAILGIVAALVLVAPFRWGALFCLACYPIPFIPTNRIAKACIKDTQFRSSVNFGIRLGLSIIYVLAFSIAMCCTQGAFWGTVLPGIGGFWWGLAAFVIPFALAYITGLGVSWLRGTAQNWYFFWKKLFNAHAYHEIKSIRTDLEKTVEI